MKKTIGALSLAVGLSMVGNVVLAENIQFVDVLENNWAYEDINWGVSAGLIDGYEDGTYKPEADINEAELVTILSKYLKDVEAGNKISGKHWSQHFYNSLEKYELPINYKNDKEKVKALSRGEIARIIAAKNGFNLTERQAIYYMYENDLSYGMIEGKLSFESYGADETVKREQIPSFFKKLNDAGHTTFMGKPSPVKTPDGIAGIKDVPQEKVEITDEMFDKLAEDKGIGGTGKISNNDFSGAHTIAKKHGLTADTTGTTGFSIKKDSGRIIRYTKEDRDTFDLTIENYTANKAVVLDVLRATGKFTEKDIERIVEIIEVDCEKDPIPRQHRINDKQLVHPAGGIGEGNSLRLGFAWN